MRIASTAAGPVTFGRRDFVESGRAILGECGLFERLSNSEREALFARARTQRYAANETIFLMGSPGDSSVCPIVPLATCLAPMPLSTVTPSSSGGGCYGDASLT